MNRKFTEMPNLIKRLMTGPYAVFWQVFFAGVLLLVTWWLFDSGVLQGVFRAFLAALSASFSIILAALLAVLPADSEKILNEHGLLGFIAAHLILAAVFIGWPYLIARVIFRRVANLRLPYWEVLSDDNDQFIYVWLVRPPVVCLILGALFFLSFRIAFLICTFIDGPLITLTFTFAILFGSALAWIWRRLGLVL